MNKPRYMKHLKSQNDWIRKCPKCGVRLTYRSNYAWKNSVCRNSTCRKCINKGRKHTKIQKERRIASRKLNGTLHCTEETKLKLKISNTGKPHPSMAGDNNPAKRLDVRKKISENNPMRKLEHRQKLMGDNNPAKRPEVRQKLREHAIQQIKNGNWSESSKSCKMFLDGLEKILQKKIERS